MTMKQYLLAHFSRITSGGRIIPEVDGLRFVAISSIFLLHLSDEVYGKEGQRLAQSSFDKGLWFVLQQFAVGVPLFFAISGFILAIRFAQHSLRDGREVSLKSYFLRRLTRLEPTYIIALLFTVPLAVMIARVTKHHMAVVPHLVASITYTHGLFYRTMSTILGSAWSLEVEVQFYIVAPLIAHVYKLRYRALRYLLYIAAMVLAAGWQHYHYSETWKLFLPSYLQFFIVGFFLADIYVDYWDGKPLVRWYGDFCSAIGWTSMMCLLLMGGAWKALLPLSILTAYAGAFTGKWTKMSLSNPYIVTIGGMCYTIYLYHYSIIIVMSRLTFLVQMGHSFLCRLLEQIVLLGSIVLACSFLLFALFERPFMDKRWPQRLLAYFHSTRYQSNDVE
jgi:peptidoglycan/LPS O-acetylase OafA/YrhL